ncbi:MULTISPECIES: MiaB/RimO family radical SAM methylthiotransferase [unclassified Methanoculleus]|uniref:MiaB/RimO family radical SAM methylthiotransferase n=1 Tax=unclassified Methanoculleus TaxID=2619537 RepID=UPI0025EC34D4|nr:MULTISPECIES: MiaB/RimO family radical SAM methylthiotransferase [unclassified Methanoculleus]MCK9316974.1 MiaB/RimO family radical SAM methylthiotransferase [Methanoculleus sp.]MDD2252849.1 MiaB/RimO family radical SAM methylthiotransferase [Methanoculleus sp.]MDD2787186.1 MiaB/RimO family radical SAM methylthiotransferase [Methanoculleus sp.]MDD3215734.1 MiaB/RimO family radical SAM methylthiotransferase [Methanoculleus sp.]MDD4313507.1 MiaB/RimO family radical SAM methylthiotransferase [
MTLEELRGRPIYIESYGCTYNHADTQRLKEILEGLGCTLTGPDEADAVIVNTCTVIDATERKMIRRLAAFADRDLYVTGCMPLVQIERIRAVCTPHVIHPDEIHEQSCGIGTRSSGAVGVVQVASGCLGRCSYCITRLARGRLDSASPGEILDAVRCLVASGAYEIQLTGQDVAAWGFDRGESLPDLLLAIREIPGRFAVRLGMMSPASVLGILEPLVDAYESDKIFRFLHLPVQSGSDSVLGRMQRGYRAVDVLRIVDAFRERYPEMMVSSDFITGFPGETEEEFRQTLELIERAAFVKVNITRYSRRPGTAAAALKDLPERIRKVRSRALLAEANRIYDRYNERWIGRETPVVATEKNTPGSTVCRNPCYLNVVIEEDLPLGFSGRAVITGSRRHYVTGNLVPKGTGDRI